MVEVGAAWVCGCGVRLRRSVSGRGVRRFGLVWEGKEIPMEELNLPLPDEIYLLVIEE